MKSSNNGETEFEDGSGNVFADLGLDDADGRLARAKIGFHVYKILSDRKLNQRSRSARTGRVSRVRKLASGYKRADLLCVGSRKTGVFRDELSVLTHFREAAHGAASHIRSPMATARL
jgi:hypothetical protein